MIAFYYSNTQSEAKHASTWQDPGRTPIKPVSGSDKPQAAPPITAPCLISREGAKSDATRAGRLGF
jgi:hypothetical protein